MKLVRRYAATWRVSGPRAANVLALQYAARQLSRTGDANPEQVFGVEVFDPMVRPSRRRMDAGHMIHEGTPLVWFVPDWQNVWGGGHFTIFRFASLLNRSRRNIIFVYNNRRHYSGSALERELREALPGSSVRVIVDENALPDVFVPIATTWQSVYSILHLCPEGGVRFYFMQDYESWFYAHGTQSMQALATYEQGFVGITGGKWLRKCFESHGGRAMDYMFAVDQDLYHPREVSPSRPVRKIFFYARPSTERRCFELGVAALREVHRRHPEVELVVGGLDGIGDLGVPVTHVGNVSMPMLGDLYRSCDIGIALSATNLSYLPLELMSCGVPVVTNGGPHVEWFCQDRKNCLVVAPYPSAIADAVSALIADSGLREDLARRGPEATRQTTWQNEANRIEEFIEEEIRQQSRDSALQ